MEYQTKINGVVNNMKNENGVAWIYQNDAFIDTIVGEKSTLLAKVLK
jgi:hypothetical protein